MNNPAQSGAPMHAKWISLIAAFLASLFVDIPHGVVVAVWCFFWAFMADNVTGVWAAGAMRTLRSETNRNKMWPKVAAYFGIMVGFWIMGEMIGGGKECYSVFITGWAWITANEMQSNLENIVKIQVVGGVSLGLLNQPLRLLGAWFGINEKSLTNAGSTVASSATLIPADPGQPTIVTTSVEKLPGRTP